jgi:uncharacterized protein (DUF2235 family)
MAKRLIVCFDGTWNTPNEAVRGDPCQTDVSRLAGRSWTSTGPVCNSAASTRRESASTGGGDSGRSFASLSRKVRNAYRFLVHNYQPGDEIFTCSGSAGAVHRAQRSRLHPRRREPALVQSETTMGRMR